MAINDVLLSVPRGSLRSYTWVARQLGLAGDAARAAGQAIANETLVRWPTPQVESAADNTDSFPWWRVIGIQGDVLTIRENEAWYFRQVARLESEGHTLVPSRETEGLRVQPLPVGFE